MKTTKIKGLTSQQVIEQRQKYGENTLTPLKKKSLIVRFFEKFKDPLIVILCIACALSLALSSFEMFVLHEGWHVIAEPLGILLAIFLSTGLAFYFETQADKEFSLLNQVHDEELVIVLRDGKKQQVVKKDIVVGDIVYINTGDEIPADGELLKAYQLKIDESSLTGEMICHKTTDKEFFDEKATYPSYYVLRGTKVMEGHGIFRVDKVGDETENGKVYEDVQIDNSVKTPLNEQLGKLSQWITYISYAFAALIVIGRCFLYFHTTGWAMPNIGQEWTNFSIYILQSIMLAVTLIVVAVPEGLPMAVTLSLAYSMRAMLKTNNLVRKMHACETMGAVTVICTDKTGTLTQNKMRVANTGFEQGIDTQIIMNSIALNTTASLDGETVIGNPTEGALLLWMKTQGWDYQTLREEFEVEEELPFTTERKYMATLILTTEGKRILYVKGAPEILYRYCVQDDVVQRRLQTQLADFQHRGMRTLAFAYKELDNTDSPFIKKELCITNLNYIGVVAISDPVREDVPQSVQKCQDAGIRIIIVTGDSPCTAMEIGRQIGIWQPTDNEQNIIDGTTFATLSDKELQERLPILKIVARARPADKKRLVEALQKQGEIVAVTGDGTNDAPAIKAAHVGLSMGSGTAVAKEASDITILDNSFSSIGQAIMWGRSLYQNIQRFILFQMTVNVAACLIVLAGAFMGKDSPLTVTQMLWVNLIMDTFAAMALASLPPSQEVMQDKPRDRRANIISPKMFWQIIGVGGLVFIIMTGLVWIFEHMNIVATTTFVDILANIRNSNWQYDGLSLYELSLFFTIFVFVQFWNLFNAREFNSKPFIIKKRNWYAHRNFFTICLIIIVGQFLIVTFGREFFNVEPLHWQDWLKITICTMPIALLGKITRFIRQHKHCKSGI